MDFKAFYSAPSAAALCACTKDQLEQIAEHYEIEFREGLLRDELKGLVMLTLFEKGVLAKEPGGAGAEPNQVCSQSPVALERLSFEQQERLLALQLELEQVKLHVAREAVSSRTSRARKG